MTRNNNLIDHLSSIKNAKRIHRDYAAEFVINNDSCFLELLEIALDNSKKLSIKASWVLELVCIKKLHLIAPHLDLFSNNLNNISHESALRPFAKICSFISKEGLSQYENEIQKYLNSKNKERIIESNFDWLIEDHKIATHAFAMETLYQFGIEIDWIHKELKLILEKNSIKRSSGYQSKARKILNLLNKRVL